MMVDTLYCSATVVRDPLAEEGAEEVARLHSFHEVTAFLNKTYCWFADEISAENDELLSSRIGGFGVSLRNSWDSEVEVGIGRDIWFLFRIRPEPGRIFSDHPSLDGHLVFCLGGWHYTELGREMLVSRDACLTALRRWLETNDFPTSTTD